MQYSKDNHYKWGWNGQWHNDPIVDGKFAVEVAGVTREVRSFREECGNTVEDLANQFTKPIRVGLSGGGDSQAVCLSLLDRKILFEPVIMHIRGPKGGIRNEHDIKQAFEFCRKFDLKPLLIDLDLQKFYDGRGQQLAAEHCLTNARVLAQLYLIELFKDTHAFIMAGGDMVLSKGSSLEGDPIVTSFGPTPIQQHLIKYGIEGCTKFFMYSPELILSYLDHPAVKGLRLAHQAVYSSFDSIKPGIAQSWTCFSYFIKPCMYVEQFPELVQAMKYTGFENANDLVSEGQALMNIVTRQFKPLDQKIIVTLETFIEGLKSGEARLYAAP
jgi:hypothetical protein